MTRRLALVAAMVAAFACAYLATLHRLADRRGPESADGGSTIVARARTLRATRPHTRPTFTPGTSPTVELGTRHIGPLQQLILDDRVRGGATASAIDRAVADLRDGAYARHALAEPARLPRHCAWSAGVEVDHLHPRARVRVSVTEHDVTATDFHIVDGVPGDVAECLDDYFAGDGVVTRMPTDPPFVALERELELDDPVVW